MSMITSINTFDVSSIWTTIPRGDLKSRMPGLVLQCFNYNKVEDVLGVNNCNLVNEVIVKYTTGDIIRIIPFLVDTIF